MKRVERGVLEGETEGKERRDATLCGGRTKNICGLCSRGRRTALCDGERITVLGAKGCKFSSQQKRKRKEASVRVSIGICINWINSEKKGAREGQGKQYVRNIR